jgi:DNA-binding NarL/FixJ family response regulator
MIGRRPPNDPLRQLTDREREVLAAMAEGLSNLGIARSLYVSQAAVEKHVTAIFRKLGLPPADTEHRRVQAVLAYLRHRGPS